MSDLVQVATAHSIIRAELKRLNAKLRDAGLKTARVSFVENGGCGTGPWMIDNNIKYGAPGHGHQFVATPEEAELAVDELIRNRPQTPEELAATLGVQMAA